MTDQWPFFAMLLQALHECRHACSAEKCGQNNKIFRCYITKFTLTFSFLYCYFAILLFCVLFPFSDSHFLMPTAISVSVLRVYGKICPVGAGDFSYFTGTKCIPIHIS